MYLSAITALLLIICLPGQTTCQRTSYLYYSSHGQAAGLFVSGDIAMYNFVKFCRRNFN